MKITFITGHLCKERHALLYELALDLGEYGAKVTVITGFPSRRIPDEVRKYYLEHPVEQISENVVVKRVGTRKGEGTGLLERMVKYLFLTKAIYREVKKLPTNVYYIYSSPPFLGYIGCRLAKGVPTLYNAQDLFPDTLIHMKHLNERNLLIRFFKRKEVQVYQKNTRIVTISEEMKHTIVATGCPKEKINIICNWADTDSLHHVEREDNHLMDELGIDKSKFVISYAGDIGLFQGWDVILNAAKRIKNTNPDILFVIIGSGSFKIQLEDRIENENIENVLIRPLQPARRLSEVYSIGDIEIVPIETGITKMALPSKISVIMATGSPILALVDSGSDIEQIINKQKIGIAIEHGDANRLVAAIEYCYANKQVLPEWGKNASTFAVKNYSRKIQTRKYYDSLVNLVEHYSKCQK